MDLPNTPSPSHALRRRKKRSTPTAVVPPGSSLNGLNRSSIRYVELGRGSMGYGFTISGQKPCLLRCIVEGSPAEAASLRPGNCLVGVNGIDVSHRAHDDVVGIIGSCTGLLRLHVADSYFSESSEDDTFQAHHQRPKYPHKPRALSKSALNSKKLDHSKLPMLDPSSSENLVLKSMRPMPQTPDPRPRRVSPSARRSSWDPLMPTPRRGSRPPLPVNNFLDTATPPILPVKKCSSGGNPLVEIVSVFGHVESKSQKSSLPGPSKSVDMNDRFNTQSSSGSSHGRANSLMGIRQISGSSLNAECSQSSSSSSSMYQAVVGYIGSMELPEIEQRKRLQALSSCVRRLRLEKRVRSIVLLRIQPNGICLFSSNQNVENGTPPLAFYSSSIIAFCGAYSYDRRFFGLVTCTGPSKSSSCHVFMVEPKLLSHTEHFRRARAFGIECTTLSLPKNGQVLGLQECSEFPATADPILSSILQLHCSPPEGMNRSIPQMSQRSPSEASNRLESTNSSNSDSGIGFRDESDRLSARIYDIVDPEIFVETNTKSRCHSPAPKKRFPFSRKQIQPTPPQGSQKSSSAVSTKLPKIRSAFHLPDQSGFDEFESDPNSMNEILGMKPVPAPPVPAKRFNTRDVIRDRLSLNPIGTRKQQPRPIEVSVLVTPPRVPEKRQRSSMELMTPISPSKLSFENLQNSTNDKDGKRTSLSRNHHGTRSLDNLCSPEILKESSVSSGLEFKGTLGSSTPALNQDTGKGQCADDFWDFKVPHAPKPKMEVSRYDKWAESIEKLLGDPLGLDVFTKFLQGEISAENIHFYTRCLEYKQTFPDLTQSQRISKASTIFQCYLQNGATEAINVDCQARNEVEKALSQPTREMFNLPLAQVFDLLKFDCYPRFLRSDMYRDYVSGVASLQDSAGEPSDSDQDSVKSHKLHHDDRRRSLLPWNKSRSKGSKHRNKNDPDGLNADISFIQRAAGNPSFDGSDHEEGPRRQSCKLCRIHLPDNSATVFPCNPGETLNTAVQRLLEKREFHYSSFEVVSVATGKALDLSMEVSEMISREIRVEPRASVRIELPLGWIVGVRANPTRKLSEVLKPILNQHKLKLDAVVVYDGKSDKLVDIYECTIGKVDGLSLYVKLKGDPRLEEITNQIPSYDFNRKGGEIFMDDDQTSAKTSSSHTSSLFGEFMRKSSKKFKRNKGQPNPLANDGDCQSQNSRTSEVVVQMHGSERETSAIANRATAMGLTTKISDEENCHPRRQTSRHNSVPTTGAMDSPLSLIRSEFNFAENSRNRKPIYITQSNEQNKS